MKKKTFIFSLFAFLFIFNFAFAAGLIPCGGQGEDPCTFCDLFKLMKNIIDFVLVDIVPPLAVLIFVAAGIMFFTSAGDPGMLTRSRNIFKSAIIGLSIVYGSWIIIGLILEIMGVAQWTGLSSHGWFQIQCSH